MKDSGPREEFAARMLINPFYAITVDPTLAVSHQPLVTRELWIGANASLIKKLGAKAYLAKLLDVLEGGYPRSDDEIP